MFISNLHNAILGINGRLNLAVGEVNHYVDDSDPDLVARIKDLENAKLIAVSNEPGLVKTGITGKVVKSVGVDTGAIGNGPRSAAKAQTAKTEMETITENLAEEKPAAKTTKTRKATKAVEAEVPAEA